MFEPRNYAHKVFISVGIATFYLVVLALLVSSIKVLLLVFAGVIIAVPLTWLVDKLQHRWQRPRGLILTGVLLTLITLVASLIALAVPALSEQVQKLVESLPQTLEKVREVAQQYSLTQPVAEALANPQELLTNVDMPVQQLLQRVPGVFSTTLAFIAIPLITLVIGAYIAAEPRLYTHGFTRLFPKTKRKRILELLQQLGHTLRWWLLGQSIAMTILGVITGIFLYALSIPLALLLAVITAITNFVPNIGPFLAGIPAVLMALTVGPWHALAVIVFFVVLQNIEGTILTPMIQRRIISLPPVLIITAQILLSSLIGIVGVILAMPLVACLIVIVKMLYVEDVLEAEAPTRPA